MIRALHLVRKAPGCYEKKSDALQLVLLITGIGSTRSQAAAEAALKENPSLLISAGYAGAVNPEFCPGEVLVDVRNAPDHAAVAERSGAKRARIVTVSAPVLTPGERAAVHEHGVDAVEMEGDAIIQAAKAANVPVLRIRAISDDAREDLSPILGTRRSVRVGEIVLRLIVRPHLWPRVWRLARYSRLAGARLAIFMGELFGA